MGLLNAVNLKGELVNRDLGSGGWAVVTEQGVNRSEPVRNGNSRLNVGVK